MTRGRKPTHAALKVYRGNPGKRRIHADVAPPAITLPKPPEHLTGEAKAAWERIGKQLVTLGVFSEADGTALEALCSAYAQWRANQHATDQIGSVLVARDGEGKVKTDKNGLPILKRNTYAIEAQKWMAWLLRWLGEFGLTPAARARIQHGGTNADARDAVQKILDAS